MERYQRHLTLHNIGQQGQAKLLNSSILIVGAGGLGCPALLYLCSSGIGRIGVADGDVVEQSNLARQILYSEADVGTHKVDVVANRLQRMRADLKLDIYRKAIDASNVDDLIEGYDVVLDCTDNYEVRYVLNDSCEQSKTPLVYAALFKFEGQMSVFHYKDGPGLRDLFPDKDELARVPSCADVGVFSPLPGIMGSMQAAEAIKVLLGLGEVCSGQLMIYNSLKSEMKSLVLR